MGCDNQGSVIAAGGALWFQARDGSYYVTKGGEGDARSVTSHVTNEFETPVNSSVSYTREADGQALHLSATRPGENDRIMRADPDSLRRDDSTGEYALSWYRLDLPGAGCRVWEAGDNLYCIDSAGAVSRIDDTATPTTGNVGVVLTFDLTGNNLVTRASLTTNDSDGTISLVGEGGVEQGMDVTEAHRVSSIHRKVNESIRPSDPVAPVISYESNDGGVLLSVGWTGAQRSF